MLPACPCTIECRRLGFRLYLNLTANTVHLVSIPLGLLLYVSASYASETDLFVVVSVRLSVCPSVVEIAEQETRQEMRYRNVT